MKGRRSVTLTLLGAFLLLLTAASQAQHGGYSNLTFQPKSEATALRYSLFGTVLPIATGIAMFHSEKLFAPGLFLGAAGIMVGPSLGYFYGGCTGRGLTGTGIRFGVAGLAAALAAAMVAESRKRHSTGGDGGWGYFEVRDEVAPMLVIGSSIIVIDTIYDIAKVKSTVRKHNEKMQARSLSIVPTYSPDSDAAGLALQITF